MIYRIWNSALHHHQHIARQNSRSPSLKQTGPHRERAEPTLLEFRARYIQLRKTTVLYRPSALQVVNFQLPPSASTIRPLEQMNKTGQAWNCKTVCRNAPWVNATKLSRVAAPRVKSTSFKGDLPRRLLYSHAHMFFRWLCDVFATPSIVAYPVSHRTCVT